MNLVPSINAVAGMHDMFQIGLQYMGGPWMRNIFNVPGMPIAATMTWVAMRDTPYMTYETLRQIQAVGQ
jgi:hypothetical protein